jgi:MFS family permease
MHIPPALKHRPFLLYWIGFMVSAIGSQMQLWAIYWHLRTLSDQPLVISGIGLARFLPVIILSLFAGVVADHFNRRKLTIATQTALIFVAIALGVLTYLGETTLWTIYILVVIQSIAVSFDLPARQSIIPSLVPREDLASAYSMNSISSNVGSILGPAICGLIIAYLGIQWAYWINAISYLAVIVALIAMGPVQSKIKRTALHFKKTILDIKAGIRFIRNSPIILSSMIVDFVASFFSSANTLLPFVARDILHVGAIQYGWLSAAQSVGTVSVALFVSQRRHLVRQGMLLTGAVVIFGLATIVFGLSTSFWITMAALIVIGAADGLNTIIRNTLRQLQTPDSMRGRMLSINMIFFKGGPQLGEVESGIVAQAFGVPAAIISGGIGCVLAVWLVISRFPQLFRYNGDEPMVVDQPIEQNGSAA